MYMSVVYTGPATNIAPGPSLRDLVFLSITTTSTSEIDYQLDAFCLGFRAYELRSREILRVAIPSRDRADFSSCSPARAEAARRHFAARQHFLSASNSLLGLLVL